jgi:peptidoglycan/xylan/chitin deacetylase (PgdA/CDA1 family)
MYHACEAADTDFTRGLSINTTPQQFASHLDFLMDHYRVVPLADLIELTPTVPTVALTFDDGFQSVYEQAWPLLSKRKLTATCYLVTDVIDNTSLIWINELNWFMNRHGPLTRSLIEKEFGLDVRRTIKAILQDVLDQYEPSKIAQLLIFLREANGEAPGMLARTSQLHLRWDQIAELASSGMAFGNHTCSHPPLATLPIESCRQEIQRAASVVSHLPGAAATLAYPFGSRTDETRRVAIDLGYRSLLEVEGINGPLDPTRIGRIKVGAITASVLFARMEVVEPVKAALKRWSRLVRTRRRSEKATSSGS